MGIDERVKKLLASGNLTGKEAGKLVIQDSWLVDNGREGFLSERDIQAIKSGLHNQKDIEDYNSYVHTYRLIDFTLKEGHILALELQRDLILATKLIDDYILEDRLRTIQLYSLPAIVTQKQYDELSSRQKANKLKETVRLQDVLENRALLLAGPELESEWMDGDEDGVFYEYFIHHLQKFYPDKWIETVSQVLEMLREGRIQPVLVDKAGQAKLERLWKKVRAVPVSDKDIRTQVARASDIASNDARLVKLYKEELLLLEELYRNGHRSQAQLISQLEKLMAGSLSEDEQDKLLDFNLCSVEELYQAGLPEWVEHVDKYIPNLDEETSARPLDMMQSTRVAIVQNPDADDMDEMGYYKERNLLGVLTGLSKGVFYRRESNNTRFKQTELTNQKDERRLSKEITSDEYLRTLDKMSKERLKTFSAMLTVLDAVSDVIGIDFAEDMRAWHEMSEMIIGIYNNMAKNNLIYLGMPELKPIKLDSLKPSRSTVKYIQERLAMGLGEGWQDAVKALAEDLKAKEAEDGQKEPA